MLRSSSKVISEVLGKTKGPNSMSKVSYLGSKESGCSSKPTFLDDSKPEETTEIRYSVDESSDAEWLGSKEDEYSKCEKVSVY